MKLSNLPPGVTDFDIEEAQHGEPASTVLPEGETVETVKAWYKDYIETLYASTSTQVSELTAERDRLQASVEALVTGEIELCPTCNNVGYYAVGPTDDPQQRPCEFCCTVPNSLFNIKEKVRAALATVGGGK
jgi:hypothetical protein